MKRLTAILWKEWHEARWFLAVALFLFIGMPLIGGIEGHFAYQQRFDFLASPWVIPLGGLLAIFTAVGITCRDLGDRLEDFWRSRAIDPVRWVLVKYTVGLAVVLFSCAAPLLLEMKIDDARTNTVVPAIILADAVLCAVLYSIAFLAGCMVRRTAHATMLGLAGMLLVYFLPIVLPFMRWLSPEAAMTEPARGVLMGRALTAWMPVIAYFCGMLVIVAAAMVLSLFAVRQGWRIISGTKMMYWSVGSTLLLLFATAAFRLATNLPVLAAADLPHGRYVTAMQFEDSQGWVLTHANTIGQPRGLHFFSLTGARLELGPEIVLPRDSLFSPLQGYAMNRHVLYSIFERKLPDKRYSMELRVTDLDGALQPKVAAMFESRWSGCQCFIRGQRLYVMSENLVTYDIRVPTDPKLLGTEKFRSGKYPGEPSRYGVRRSFRIVPGFSQRESLEITAQSWHGMALDGDILVGPGSNGLFTYELRQLKDGVAYFDDVGFYNPSLLERIFGSVSTNAKATAGLAFLSQENTQVGKSTARVNVFDIHDPRRPHPIGHFATPSIFPLVLWPLPDGRSLAGGEKLLLLGKPPGKD